MSHHKKHSHPVPPANQAGGPNQGMEQEHSESPGRHKPTDGRSFQEQDAERRLGDFSGAGEHPRQQPTPLNDGTKHSK